MNLLKFVNQETDAPKIFILFVAMLSGVANSLILAIINHAAEVVGSNNQVETQLFFLYLITFTIFILTTRYSFSQAIISLEQAVAKIRLRIADKIRYSELRFLENKGKAEIYTYLTQDTNLISQSAFFIVVAAQSSIILLFSLFYILWLSPFGFVLIISFLGLGILIYFSFYEGISSILSATTIKETEFFEALNHILEGFKEIKINQRKSDDLFKYVETISQETKQLKIRLHLKFVIDVMFSRIFSNIILGIIVFVLPIFSPTHAEVIIKITAAFLFIMGPIEMIVVSIPLFTQANMAVKNLHNLETELDATHQTINQTTIESPQNAKHNLVSFNKIQLDGLRFQYVDQEGTPLFHVGPLNLTIQQGEILFIVGGNGSGKSTLLKLLTGLYYPHTGTIAVDDEIITPNNYQAYRELFSIIFTDFHLFDRLYGLPKVDEQQLKTLLQLMELEKKTQYLDGKFTHLNLSTGQKKRLAFIATVLEDKPIYILDELAADQDPHFRKYFYQKVLPDLREQGKTIIAVTHDDMYFQMADRIIKMDYGKIIDL